MSDTADMLEQSRDILYGAYGVDAEHMLAAVSAPHTNLQSTNYCDIINSTQEIEKSCDQNIADPNCMPKWAVGMCRQLENIQLTLNVHTTKWSTVEKQLESQNIRMTNIETQISQIGTIKEKLSTHETKVISMNMRVGEMQDKIDDYDRSIHYYSQTCDDLIRSNTSLKENVENLTTKVEYLQNQQTDINIRQSNADEKLIDIQWRSMRENLIFTGISEPWDRSKVNEYCKSMVREFIRDELHIDKEISFDRVHRLGRYSRYQRYPRPIVVKFTFYKDKELVRVAESQYLTGNRYRVKEQFPSEIEERRKLLYGEARSARQNRNNRVKLVRDKLYINGRQYVPGCRIIRTIRIAQTEIRHHDKSNEIRTITEPKMLQDKMVAEYILTETSMIHNNMDTVVLQMDGTNYNNIQHHSH